MAKGGGDEGAARSRRKSSGEPASGGKPLSVEPRKIVTAVVVVAFVALLWFVTQKEGGAPQGENAVLQKRGAVESWSYAAETPSGDRRALCAHDTDPCDPDELWRLHATNATCTLRTEVLLSNAGMPVLLRGVEATLNATAWGGDYTISNDTTSPLNLTTVWVEKDLAWDNGWWWRVEDETVSFRIEVPCDSHTASFTVRVRAAELDGDAWDDTQQVRVAMHEEYLTRLAEGGRGAQPFT